MKKIFFISLLLCVSWTSYGQEFLLKISGKDRTEDKIIDSIGFVAKHKNLKGATDENNLFFEKLLRNGYSESQLLEKARPNDTTVVFKYDIGRKTTSIHIYIGNENRGYVPSAFSVKNDTVTITYAETEFFLTSVLKQLEADGFSMAKTKLTDIRSKKNFLTASLSATKENKRSVNDIVVNGYDKFPVSHKKNILRQYKNKVFNQKNLDRLYNDFEKFRFVKQTKYPEILFTKDSTKIYVYLEKARPNSFDGFIGFTNDENKKMVLSGYLDLTLNNILNSGEKLALYWKSDGMDQKTFNLGVELPYIFKSPLGLKTELNIFKQDSTFQNTRTAIDLGYLFNYNTRLYLGYQSTESSDIQNTNSATLSDYDNSFVTASLEFSDFKNDDYLFPEKTRFSCKIGSGKRQAKTRSDNQAYASLFLKHNIYLNDKNIFCIKSQDFYLQSNSYIINELQRFGGINSIRGFNENSLQGNAFGSILTEYRYILTPSLYIHSIIDYAYLQDKTTATDQNLLGLGLGLGLLTKNGLFNLIYANGSAGGQNVKLSNSIVHVSFRANF